MRVSTTTRVLGDCVRTVALVTDDRQLAASATIEEGDAIAALDMLELRLREAIQALRDERARLEREAA